MDSSFSMDKARIHCQTREKDTDVYGRPDRSRPKSRGYDAGLFIQDEYAINPYLTLTPVLRWSYYNRKPTTDNNDKFGLASRSDSKVTPGITLTPEFDSYFWAKARPALSLSPKIFTVNVA